MSTGFVVDSAAGAHLRAEFPRCLLDPEAYPHQVSDIQLVETHMSWLLLTGEFVYKVKKPVKFEFADFGSQERRRFYCNEELRLNAGFAPDLYLGVVPIFVTESGQARLGEAPVPPADQGSEIGVVDWCVKMREFNTSHQADVLVAADQTTADQFYRFGKLLAGQHGALSAQLNAASIGPAIRENFATLTSLDCAVLWHSRLEKLAIEVDRSIEKNSKILAKRVADGFVRECHGDLHLSNMVAIDDRLLAFDALEFSRELREVDVWNDAAFLVMDCLVRGRSDLAYAFVDGYLQGGADYEGLLLLPLYCDYRSMVRAKVAALVLSQLPGGEPGSANARKSSTDKLEMHLSWVEERVARGPGALVITCGLSGSGKSYWAQQLVPELGALRVRTDILRKQRAGLAPRARSGSELGGGLYTAQSTDGVYLDLSRRITALLRSGELVIVDAACLHKRQRALLLEAAHNANAQALVLHLTAAKEVLKQRIRSRGASDASEADESVLQWQLDHQEPPGGAEPVLSVDTEDTTLAALACAIRQRLLI